MTTEDENLAEKKTPELKRPHCAVCRFYWDIYKVELTESDPRYKDDFGQPWVAQCRRYAPQPLRASPYKHMSHEPFDAVWPGVEKQDWCGEFEPKPQEPAND